MFSAIILIAVVAAIALWARRIEKRIGPPSKDDREGRFYFRHGGDPPNM